MGWMILKCEEEYNGEMVFMWFRLVGLIVEKWEVIWIHINLNNNNNTYRILHRLVFPLHSSIFYNWLCCDDVIRLFRWCFQRIFCDIICMLYLCWFFMAIEIMLFSEFCMALVASFICVDFYGRSDYVFVRIS